MPVMDVTTGGIAQLYLLLEISQIITSNLNVKALI
jgi:hypothetical protein